MKAIFYSENGGPEVMTYGDRPDPLVGEHDVLLRVEAIAIEGGDLLNRLIAPLETVPLVPGYQAGGTVEAIGARVTRFVPGQRVVAFNWSGSHAELMAAPEDFCFPVPDDLDMMVAAAAPIAFGTAHDAVIEYGHLRAGETILIQGAAGGVGLAAVQIAREHGGVVIGTASGPERLERLKALGLNHAIDYRAEDIAARCHAITDGKGVDLAIDLAGGAGKDLLVKALRPHGRYGAVGASTGEIPSFSFFDLIGERLNVYGVSLGREMHEQRVRDLVAMVFAKLADGTYQMPVDRVFPLSEAVEAHRHVATGHPFGRVMMTP